MRRYLRRPSPAMVVAFIALMAALAPTAAALRGSSIISKDDFKTGAADKRAVGTNAVAKREIARDQVGINEIAEEGDPDGGLDGRQIVEAKLAKVPAATAADTVGGYAVAPFTTLNGGQRGSLARSGPFELIGACTDNGGGVFTAAVVLRNNGANGAVVEVGGTDTPLNTGQEVQVASANGAAAAVGHAAFGAVSPDRAAIAGDAVAAVHAGGSCSFGGGIRG